MKQAKERTRVCTPPVNGGASCESLGPAVEQCSQGDDCAGTRTKNTIIPLTAEKYPSSNHSHTILGVEMQCGLCFEARGVWSHSKLQNLGLKFKSPVVCTGAPLSAAQSV